MAHRNRSANQLVALLKRSTRNKDLADAQGETIEAISEEDVLQALNEGKRIIQMAVANPCPWFSRALETVAITSRLVEFPVPATALYGDRVFRLDYSLANSDRDFRPLEKGDPRENNYIEGEPCTYYHNGTNVIVEPAPSSGYYRFLIQREDDQLDCRRGLVASVSALGGDLVSITLDTADALFNSINHEALEAAEFVCVCDYRGENPLYNVPVQSYDRATGVITARSGFAYTSGISAGMYVVAGQYTTTHSKLPSGFEDYVLAYARYRILNWDSHSDQIQEIPILQTIKATLIEGITEQAGEETILENGNFLGDWFSK